MSLIDRLSSIQGRITTGMTLVAAVAIGLWPEQSREFDPTKASAIVLATVAWLFAEFGASTTPSEHDQGLFERIFEQLNDGMMDFLAHHDFAVNFGEGQTKAVHEIAYWHGAQYEFNDHRLNREWDKLKAQISDLSRMFGNNLTTTDKGNRLTVYMTGFPRNEQPPQVYKEIGELNEAATSLYHKANEFRRLANARLKL